MPPKKKKGNGSDQAGASSQTPSSTPTASPQSGRPQAARPFQPQGQPPTSSGSSTGQPALLSTPVTKTREPPSFSEQSSPTLNEPSTQGMSASTTPARSTVLTDRPRGRAQRRPLATTLSAQILECPSTQPPQTPAASTTAQPASRPMLNSFSKPSQQSPLAIEVQPSLVPSGDLQAAAADPSPMAVPVAMDQFPPSHNMQEVNLTLKSKATCHPTYSVVRPYNTLHEENGAQLFAQSLLPHEEARHAPRPTNPRDKFIDDIDSIAASLGVHIKKRGDFVTLFEVKSSLEKKLSPDQQQKMSAFRVQLHKDIPVLAAIGLKEKSINAAIRAVHAVDPLICFKELEIIVVHLLKLSRLESSNEINKFEDLGMGALERAPIVCEYYDIPLDSRNCIPVYSHDIYMALVERLRQRPPLARNRNVGDMNRETITWERLLKTVAEAKAVPVSALRLPRHFLCNDGTLHIGWMITQVCAVLDKTNGDRRKIMATIYQQVRQKMRNEVENQAKEELAASLPDLEHIKQKLKVEALLSLDRLVVSASISTFSSFLKLDDNISSPSNFIIAPLKLLLTSESCHSLFFAAAKQISAENGPSAESVGGMIRNLLDRWTAEIRSHHRRQPEGLHHPTAPLEKIQDTNDTIIDQRIVFASLAGLIYLFAGFARIHHRLLQHTETSLVKENTGANLLITNEETSQFLQILQLPQTPTPDIDKTAGTICADAINLAASNAEDVWKGTVHNIFLGALKYQIFAELSKTGLKYSIGDLEAALNYFEESVSPVNDLLSKLDRLSYEEPDGNNVLVHAETFDKLVSQAIEQGWSLSKKSNRSAVSLSGALLHELIAVLECACLDADGKWPQMAYAAVDRVQHHFVLTNAADLCPQLLESAQAASETEFLSLLDQLKEEDAVTAHRDTWASAAQKVWAPPPPSCWLLSTLPASIDEQFNRAGDNPTVAISQLVGAPVHATPVTQLHSIDLPEVAAALAAVPWGHDAAHVLAWSTLYAPQYGPLFCALQEPDLKAACCKAGVRFLEEPRGCFLRVPGPEQTSVKFWMQAVRNRDIARAAAVAAALLSFGNRTPTHQGTVLKQLRNDLVQANMEVFGVVSDSPDEMRDDVFAYKASQQRNKQCAEFAMNIVALLPPSLRATVGLCVVLPALIDPSPSLNMDGENIASALPETDFRLRGAAAEIAAKALHSPNFGMSQKTTVRAFLNALLLPFSITSIPTSAIAAPDLPDLANMRVGWQPDRDKLVTATQKAEEEPAPGLKDSSTVPGSQPALANNVNPSSWMAAVPRQDQDGPNASVAASNTPLVISEDSVPDECFFDSMDSAEAKLIAKALEGHTLPPSRKTAMALIRYIHSIWTKADTDEDDIRNRSAIKSVERLSGELYSNPAHFLQELLQNFDDASYPPNIIPQATFALSLTVNNTIELRVSTNEVGFRVCDVHGICRGGDSTKKIGAGTTGHKGIGWKSVFKASARPQVHSGHVHLVLDTRPPQLGGLGPRGLLAPQWVEPASVQVADPTPGTIVILPLEYTSRGRKVGICEPIPAPKVAEALRELAKQHSILLFLRKLRRLQIAVFPHSPLMVSNVEGAFDSRRQLSHQHFTLERASEEVISADSFINASLDAANSTFTCIRILSCQFSKTVDTTETVNLLDPVQRLTHDWLVYHLREVPSESNLASEHRQTTGCSLAFPIEQATFSGHWKKLPSQFAFCYLPLADYGLKMILQAEFVLPSDREDITVGDSHNQNILFNSFPRAFGVAFSAFATIGRRVLQENKSNEASSIPPHVTISCAYLQFLPIKGGILKPSSDVAEAADKVALFVHQHVACIPTLDGQWVRPCDAFRVTAGAAVSVRDVTGWQGPDRGGSGLNGTDSFVKQLEACGLSVTGVEATLNKRLVHPALVLPEEVWSALNVPKWGLSDAVILLRDLYATEPGSTNHESLQPAARARRFIGWLELLQNARSVADASFRGMQKVSGLIDNVPFIPLENSPDLARLSDQIALVDSSAQKAAAAVIPRENNSEPSGVSAEPTLTKLAHPPGNRLQSALAQLSTAGMMPMLNLLCSHASQVLAERPALRQFLQELGVQSLSFTYMLRRTVLPMLQQAQSLSQSKLIACMDLVRHWVFDHIDHASGFVRSTTDLSGTDNDTVFLTFKDTDDRKLWTEVRLAAVFVTESGAYVRIRPRHTPDVAGAIVDPARIDMPIVDLHTHPDLLEDEEAQRLCRVMHEALSVVATAACAQISSGSQKGDAEGFCRWNITNRGYQQQALQSAKYTGEGHEADVRKEWRILFECFGITESFVGVPMKTSGQLAIGHSRPPLFTPLAVDRRMTARRRGQTETTVTASGPQSKELETIFYYLMSLCQSDNSFARYAVSALNAIAAHLAVRLDLPLVLSSSSLGVLLRDTPWLPKLLAPNTSVNAISTVGGGAQLLKLPRQLVAPLPENKKLGNLCDYSTESVLSWRGSITAANSASTHDFANFLGVIVKTEANFVLNLLSSMHMKSLEESGGLLTIDSNIYTSRFLSRGEASKHVPIALPESANSVASDAIAIASATVIAAPSVLLHVYRCFEVALATPDAHYLTVDKISFFIPALGSARNQQRLVVESNAQEVLIPGRFVHLEDVRLVSSDGVRGLMRHLDVWNLDALTATYGSKRPSMSTEAFYAPIYPAAGYLCQAVQTWTETGGLELAWVNAMKRLFDASQALQVEGNICLVAKKFGVLMPTQLPNIPQLINALLDRLGLEDEAPLREALCDPIKDLPLPLMVSRLVPNSELAGDKSEGGTSRTETQKFDGATLMLIQASRAHLDDPVQSPIFVLDDNYDVLKQMRHEYSQNLAGLARFRSRMFVIHLYEKATESSKSGDRLRRIRQLLEYLPSIRATSLSQPLFPAEDTVGYQMHSNAFGRNERRTWALVCAVLQCTVRSEIAICDEEYMVVDGLKLGAALRGIAQRVETNGVVVTHPLRVLHMARRPTGDPLLIYGTATDAQVVADNPAPFKENSCRLLIDVDALQKTRSQVDRKPESNEESKPWWMAAVDFVCRQLATMPNFTRERLLQSQGLLERTMKLLKPLLEHGAIRDKGSHAVLARLGKDKTEELIKAKNHELWYLEEDADLLPHVPDELDFGQNDEAAAEGFRRLMTKGNEQKSLRDAGQTHPDESGPTDSLDTEEVEKLRSDFCRVAMNHKQFVEQSRLARHQQRLEQQRESETSQQTQQEAPEGQMQAPAAVVLPPQVGLRASSVADDGDRQTAVVVIRYPGDASMVIKQSTNSPPQSGSLIKDIQSARTSEESAFGRMAAARDSVKNADPTLHSSETELATCGTMTCDDSLALSDGGVSTLSPASTRQNTELDAWDLRGLFRGRPTASGVVADEPDRDLTFEDRISSDHTGNPGERRSASLAAFEGMGAGPVLGATKRAGPVIKVPVGFRETPVPSLAAPALSNTALPPTVDCSRLAALLSENPPAVNIAGLSLADNELSRLIGRAGEAAAFQQLSSELSREQERARAADQPQANLFLVWVNENGESGLPYDLCMVDRASGDVQRYIEVKTTQHALPKDNGGAQLSSLRFFISPQEIAFGMKHQGKWQLALVTGLALQRNHDDGGYMASCRIVPILHPIRDINRPSEGARGHHTQLGLALHLDWLSDGSVQSSFD